MMRWALTAAGSASVVATAMGSPSPTADWMPDNVYAGKPIDDAVRGGDIEWRVEGEEIVARPRPGSQGGWIILGRPLQDVAAFVEFRCTAPCEAGLVVRVQTKGDGIEGTVARYGSDPGGIFGLQAANDAAPQYLPLTASEVQSRFAVPQGPRGSCAFGPGGR